MTDAPRAPRLPPLARERWGDDALDALRRAFPDDVVERFLSTAPAPTAITTMLHHPALAGSWLAYNNVLLWSPALEPRLRELMILRVAFRTHSAYEWEQHVKLAERSGITRAEIEAISRDDAGSDSHSWGPLERDLLAATDQLIDTYCIGDDTWQRLAAHLDERQLVETVFVVGTYTCLAMVFNSFGLQPE